MYKILIVEDDVGITDVVAKHLSNWGCETKCVSDFQNVLIDFVSYAPQLVLLDISLPFYNGYHWCGEIRKISKTPIIFISSASDNINIVMGISLGADDFIAKPFDLNVLTAKVQAILRRTYDFNDTSNLIEHNGAVFNLNDETITYQEKMIELSKNENSIMQTLFENTGKVVTRDTLMIRLWKTDNYVDENTLSVNMTRLRRKLATIGLDEFITTKKGAGYILI